MAKDQKFFIGQKAFIVKNDDVLVLHRKGMGYDMPGGKIQIGETDLENALAREVMEETGLIIKIFAPFYTWIYKIPEDSDHISAGELIFSVGYRCEYIGGEVKLSKEHDKYIWVNNKNFSDYKYIGFGEGLRKILNEK